VCVVEHSRPEDLEALVLDEFKRFRIRGEWFAMSDQYIHGYDKGEDEASRDFERTVKDFMLLNSDGKVIYGNQA
jgi:hypothetical protein